MKIVDVTLRESVYTKHNITSSEAIEYLSSIIQIEDIDYVEIGYIDYVCNNRKHLGGYDGEYINHCSQILNGKVGMSAMLHLEQFSPSKWETEIIKKLTMVRIAVNNSTTGLHEAIEFFHNLHILVSVNFSYISKIGPARFYEIIVGLSHQNIQPDIFYLADSNGRLMPFDFLEYIQCIKSVYPDKEIGIHAHNHMGLALSNTINIDSVDYVDATINGFGKGGGNTNLEHLILFINRWRKCKIDDSKLVSLYLCIRNFNDLIIKTSNNYEEEFENLLYAYKNLDLYEIAKYKRMDVNNRINKLLGLERNALEEIVKYSVDTIPYYHDRKSLYTRSFCDIPVINKHIYQQNVPPVSGRLLSNQITSSFVFSTSGTTGQPQYIVRDIKDIDYQIHDYKGLNIGKQDVVLNLFWPGIWGIYTTANITLTKLGATIIPLGGKDINEFSDEQLIDIINGFKVSVLVGVPSTIIEITKRIKTNITSLKLIQKIFCLGEKMTKEAYNFLISSYPQIEIKTKYGCMETAGIGYQCKHLSKNQYHIYMNRFVEILDNDSNSILPYGCTGRIVVTTLDKRLIPLIRYDTGDIGRLITHCCPCGVNTILEIFGRHDKEVILGSVHINIDAIHGIIKKNVKNLRAHQLVVRTKNEMDEMKLLICADIIDEHQLLLDLYMLYPDIMVLLNNKGINDIRIIKANRDDFIITKKSGKTPLVVDLRD